MPYQNTPYLERIKDALREMEVTMTAETTAACARKLNQIALEADVLREKLYQIYCAAAENDLIQIRHIFKLCACYKNEQQTTSH